MTVGKAVSIFFGGYIVISSLGILCGLIGYFSGFGVQYMTSVPPWVWWVMVPGALIGLAVGLAD